MRPCKDKDLIKKVIGELSALEERCDRFNTELLPIRQEVTRLIGDLQTILFPRFFPNPRADSMKDVLGRVHRRLMEQAALALPFAPPMGCDADCVGERFIHKLPEVKRVLLTDIEAIYNGDPAATSYEEIILCYPGFYGAMIYRLAHELYLLKLPLLPRIMTEYAHQKTGIDIHAGASIGEYFCIDHGTGVVIGETARLGKHVKLYQGVTIGARSFELDEQGNPVKGVKRHPDIGDHVVIYANATILGGDTVIGERSVIGGNAWITQSVPAGSTVYYSANGVQEEK